MKIGGVYVRGKKHTPELREKTLALYATNNNLAETAKQLNIATSTIQNWIEEAKTKDDEFVKVRNKKREELIDIAWDGVKKGATLINIRLTRALEKEQELDRLLANASREDYAEIAKNVATLKCENLSQIATALGVLYDKQALLQNEATTRVGVDSSLEKIISDMQGEEL